MAMTYASLISQVSDYLDRNDSAVTDRIPTFIDLAINNIWRQLKDIGLITKVDGTFTPGDWVFGKPVFWKRTISFTYSHGDTLTSVGSNIVNLQYRSYDFCNSYWPNRGLTDSPIYYCDYSFDFFLVVPTPVVAYPIEIRFLGQTETLSPESQTNWLTVYAPDVLFNRTMLEAVIFLKDYEVIPQWEKKYMESISGLTYQDNLRDDDGKEG